MRKYGSPTWCIYKEKSAFEYYISKGYCPYLIIQNIFKILLDVENIDLNAVDNENNTFLHILSNKYKLHYITYALEKYMNNKEKLDLTIKNNKGKLCYENGIDEHENMIIQNTFKEHGYI